MKNVNIERKTESNIMVFKDWLSRVGIHRKPEDIGVDEMYMHLAIFIFNFRITNPIHWMYLSFNQ